MSIAWVLAPSPQSPAAPPSAIRWPAHTSQASTSVGTPSPRRVNSRNNTSTLFFLVADYRVVWVAVHSRKGVCPRVTRLVAAAACFCLFLSTIATSVVKDELFHFHHDVFSGLSFDHARCHVSSRRISALRCGNTIKLVASMQTVVCIDCHFCSWNSKQERAIVISLYKT